MSMDTLRILAAENGYVLLPTEQAERIVHHVSGIYTERMRECAATFQGEADRISAMGGTVRGLEALVQTFEQSVVNMGEIVASCERVLDEDRDLLISLTWSEYGYEVRDDEYNETDEYRTEATARTAYDALKAQRLAYESARVMAQVTGSTGSTYTVVEPDGTVSASATYTREA